MQKYFRNGILSSLLFLTFFAALKCGQDTSSEKDLSAPEDRTYKNLSSDVKYEGSAKCGQCHVAQYRSFLETGMGKSFDKATKTRSSATFGKHSVIYDKFSDFYYYPFWAGDSMMIMEFRLQGKDTVHKRVETVDYIIGSGLHTNSHLMNVNGYLTQMPMTFYTQKGEWDLPPGFENGYNSRFSRKIGLECMSCHNSLPDFVKGSENKFRSVPDGIGCERCHGPGEVHMKNLTAGIVVDTSKAIDYSIVNPAKLPIDLQFDVCQRCHLQGNTVLKEGRSFYDFRPGMKLSDVMDIFLPKYENGEEDFIMASHADRLKQSQCFIKSFKEDSKALRPYKESMTCVTCHNPHVSVKTTSKEKYNNACKNCHGGKPLAVCSEKQETRTKVQDNCISCHMPKSGSIDIPHVSITDHFIRKPVKRTDIAGIKKFIGLFAVNDKDPDPRTKAQAYINQYEKFEHDPALLDSALNYLDERSPKDLSPLIHLYFLKNDFQKVISLPVNTLLSGSDDGWSNCRVGESFQNLGKINEAYPYYNHAVSLEPYNLEFLNKLAGNLFAQNRRDEAKKIYEKIISEYPDFPPAWSNLGFIYLQSGNTIKANECYNKAIALDPDYEQALVNKAGLLLFEMKNSEALVLVKKILKKNPKNEQALAIQTRLKKITLPCPRKRDP